MKVPLPENATELWRWMEKHRVTLEELALRVNVTTQYIGALRRGEKRPSDDKKIAIEEATIALEAERGITEPVGVRVEAWFRRPSVVVQG